MHQELTSVQQGTAGRALPCSALAYNSMCTVCSITACTITGISAGTIQSENAAVPSGASKTTGGVHHALPPPFVVWRMYQTLSHQCNLCQLAMRHNFDADTANSSLTTHTSATIMLSLFHFSTASIHVLQQCSILKSSHARILRASDGLYQWVSQSAGGSRSCCHRLT